MDNEISVLKKKLGEYANKNNFVLNQKPEDLLRILKGLLHNKEKYGEIYCPCRRVTGNKEEDKKIICPCIYHKEEIAKDRHCLCILFWKK